MPTIGVRELREHTSEVLRQVREHRAEYIITRQGQPVAFLSPIDAAALEAALAEAGRRSVVNRLDAYNRLAEQLRHDWPAERKTQDVLDEIRR